jgi:acetoin utilization protein AcuC
VGKGEARGRKLNIPLLPRSSDADFKMMWEKVEAFLDEWKPQFIIMQCGADGITGDPLAHLHYSPKAHQMAATGLCRIAEEHAEGRLVGVGGGGYDLHNLGKAWTTVVDVFLNAPM